MLKELFSLWTINKRIKLNSLRSKETNFSFQQKFCFVKNFEGTDLNGACGLSIQVRFEGSENHQKKEINKFLKNVKDGNN